MSPFICVIRILQFAKCTSYATSAPLASAMLQAMAGLPFASFTLGTSK
jgi:hypothetical protein